MIINHDDMGIVPSIEDLILYNAMVARLNRKRGDPGRLRARLGINRKNHEETKKRRKMAKASRKANRHK